LIETVSTRSQETEEEQLLLFPTADWDYLAVGLSRLYYSSTARCSSNTKEIAIGLFIFILSLFVVSEIGSAFIGHRYLSPPSLFAGIRPTQRFRAHFHVFGTPPFAFVAHRTFAMWPYFILNPY
jgi:hypothetical protein